MAEVYAVRGLPCQWHCKAERPRTSRGADLWHNCRRRRRGRGCRARAAIVGSARAPQPLERARRAPVPMRLPIFYGWLVVAVVFVTMGIGVNARTAFSLLFPSILEEFRWDRGVAAGAFSFGFAVSAILSPLLGGMMDRVGPRAVMELGVGLMASGLLLAPLVTEPWHLYLTLGVLVGGGSVCLGYSGQSLFLPNWFVRRRGLAIGIAFAGVGVGSIALLPLVQSVIEGFGWR